LRIKEQETRLTIHEHDDDGDDKGGLISIGRRSGPRIAHVGRSGV